METTSNTANQTISITRTRTKLQEVPTPVAGCQRIETRVRKPESLAYTIDVPTTLLPNVDAVPTIYRPLVESAVADALEEVLKGFVTSTKTAGNMQLPATLLALENLLAQSAAKRMTSAMLIGLWRNSSKYMLDVAPKLTSLQGSQLLKYKAAIEKHEKRLTALCGREPEASLSADDLDKLLVNLTDTDANSQYGQFLADRTEAVRGKLVDVDDAL